MAEYVYGGKTFIFWITQLATFAILILAANTAYNGFPGLSSIVARDGYLPRQLANRGTSSCSPTASSSSLSRPPS